MCNFSINLQIMDKQVTITKVRLTALRYFKECNDDNLYEDFRTEYSVQECGDAFEVSRAVVNGRGAQQQDLG